MLFDILYRHPECAIATLTRATLEILHQTTQCRENFISWEIFPSSLYPAKDKEQLKIFGE